MKTDEARRFAVERIAGLEQPRQSQRLADFKNRPAISGSDQPQIEIRRERPGAFRQRWSGGSYREILTSLRFGH